MAAQSPAGRETVYLTRNVVFGSGDSSVCFVDEVRNIRKPLIGKDGEILRFPGVVKEDFWVGQVSPEALRPKIRYRTSFEKREERWIMLWEIQPDGAYWRDESGFGGENEEEVTLYTYVDENGDFTDPFRIYEIGDRQCSLDRFEQTHKWKYDTALQHLRSAKLEERDEFLFPRVQGLGLSCGIHRLSDYYALWSREDAVAYLERPVLGAHLRESVCVLLSLECPVEKIAPYPLDRSIHSSATLFAIVGGGKFQAVLDKFFDGKPEENTVKRLARTVAS